MAQNQIYTEIKIGHVGVNEEVKTKEKAPGGSLNISSHSSESGEFAFAFLCASTACPQLMVSTYSTFHSCRVDQLPFAL